MVPRTWLACVLVASLCVGVHTCAAAAVQPPPKDAVAVFTSGEAGYSGCMKIPYILALRRNGTYTGTLLAFAEARNNSCSDYAWTDLVMKRSVDNGNTWGPLSVVFSNSSSPSDFAVLYTFSDDEGKTWASVVEVPSATRPSWHWIGLGPPAGLQLPSGRIVIPAYHGPFHWDDGTLTHVHTIVSDDVGKTWRIGCVPDNGTDLLFANECQAAVTPDGRLLISARTLWEHRAQSYSHDGGLTCSPMEKAEDLQEPFDGVEGSLVSFPPDAPRTMFFTNPDEHALLGYRYNLSLKQSHDSGASWQAVRVLDSGPSGYSALTALGNGTATTPSSLGVLYEITNKTEIVMKPQHIVFKQAWP